jgi:hypothetical protein
MRYIRHGYATYRMERKERRTDRRMEVQTVASVCLTLSKRAALVDGVSVGDDWNGKDREFNTRSLV